jgi:hypothetical protein
MTLQRQPIDRRRISLEGLPGERTPRLPFWKRTLDLVFRRAMSPGLVILGVGVVLLVKCGSRGQALFRHPSPSPAGMPKSVDWYRL